ncbi:MAG TPA: hypothetical protein QGE93_06950 [Acidobacteriota bacterium]|jgi:hypothetical protein|nr:hypothetical protein [Acidobacteriota bacterium]|tara:strand:- start:263 stop:430 length:168 start_codon:yes stop_codon:yes gene_type:complete
MLKALALVVLVQVVAPTQELAPGTWYDTSIPTLEQVPGYNFSIKIAAADQMIAYM